MPSIRYRLHEWLAERSRLVQFPDPRRIRQPLFQWATAMPLWQRIFIAVMSLILVLIGLGLLIPMGFIAWAILKP